MTDHIRIGDVRPRVQYLADGNLRTFDYPFAIFDEADLTVFLNETEQQAGYAVHGAGRSSGGSVAFDTAPAAGVRITLQRIVAVERSTDFQEGGAFRARSINDELDRQIAMIQQIADEAARALTAGPTDPTVRLSLPVRDERAGRYLAFDAEGGAIAAGGPPPTPATRFAAALLDDGDAAAARRTLGLGALATRSSVDAGDLAARINPLGRHTAWVPAGAMTGETGSEPASVTRKLAGGLMLTSLEFDPATPQYAQFALAMPRGWNGGDFTLRLLWSAGSGSGSVRFMVQAAAIGDDEALDTAFPAAVAVEDGLHAADDLHRSPESAAIVAAGNRAGAALVQFRIHRDAAHASDSLAAAVQLLGVLVRFGLDSANDD